MRKVLGSLVTLALLLPVHLPAQSLFERNQRQSVSGKADAPIDFTGTWVSIVNEDWRWRMVTPAKGDFASIPMTDEAKRVAMQWDPDALGPEDRCKSYGAAGLMRVPMRMRISWVDDNTLKVETDSGRQTRLLQFKPVPGAAASPTRQGVSTAAWVLPTGPGRPRIEGPFGYLKVVTTTMLPGFLRSNGVPYSGDATMTEYWELQQGQDGKQWIVITSIVDDAVNLREPFMTSPNFRKEADDSRWSPTPCLAAW
jgi:hypothetical protein